MITVNGAENNRSMALVRSEDCDISTDLQGLDSSPYFSEQAVFGDVGTFQDPDMILLDKMCPSRGLSSLNYVAHNLICKLHNIFYIYIYIYIYTIKLHNNSG
jgi:hypothetical protein